MTAPSAPGMMECQVCQMDVPAGEYCGQCGVPLDEHRPGDGPHWLRARAFSAASGQRLLTPSLTSSLFPHLTPRARIVFLMGLGMLVAALAIVTVLRMPAGSNPSWMTAAVVGQAAETGDGVQELPDTDSLPVDSSKES